MLQLNFHLCKMGAMERDLGQGEDEDYGSRGGCALGRKRKEAWFSGIIIRLDPGDYSESLRHKAASSAYSLSSSHLVCLLSGDKNSSYFI